VRDIKRPRYDSFLSAEQKHAVFDVCQQVHHHRERLEHLRNSVIFAYSLDTPRPVVVQLSLDDAQHVHPPFKDVFLPEFLGVFLVLELRQQAVALAPVRALAHTLRLRPQSHQLHGLAGGWREQHLAHGAVQLVECWFPSTALHVLLELRKCKSLSLWAWQNLGDAIYQMKSAPNNWIVAIVVFTYREMRHSLRIHWEQNQVFATSSLHLREAPAYSVLLPCFDQIYLRCR